MATSPTPMPDQGSSAASSGSGASPAPSPSSSAAPSQSPANDMQMLLSKWYQTAKQMASADPRIASGMEKVAQGIQEAQTALVSPPQPTPLGQQPTY